MKFFDRVEINSKNVKETDEGYLIIPANFARTGIYDYKGIGRGLLYRDASQVFNADSMATILGKSLTITHPTEKVTPDNWKDVEVGQVLSVEQSDTFLAGELIIKDSKAINFVKDSISKGKAIELSCGYDAQMSDNKGTFEGKSYDGTQENIRYNHIALVPKGRAGSEVKLLIDSMTEKKKMKLRFQDSTIEVEDADVKIVEAAEKLFNDTKKKNEDLEAQIKVSDAKSKVLEDKVKDLEKVAVTDAQVEEMAKEISEVESIMDALKLEKKDTLKENKESIIDHYLKPLNIKDEEDVKVFDTAWKSAKIMAEDAVKANKSKIGDGKVESVEDAIFKEDK